MKKILIIEDNPIVAQLYRSRFQKENYEVEIAPDGQTGFYAIYETKPDAVLLDLMLPQMDGVAILGKIRAQKQFAKLPVFVFSNEFMSNMMNDALAAGATQIFNKSDPTVLQQIVAAVQKALFPFLNHPGFSAPAPQAAADLVAPVAQPAPVAQAIPEISGFPTAPAEPAQPAAPPQPSVPSSPSLGAAPSAPMVPRMTSTPPIQTEGPVEKPASPGVDEKGLDLELRAMFFSGSMDTVQAMRKFLLAINKAPDEAGKLEALNGLYRKVHGITGNAAVCGMQSFSHLCAVLEALLRDLVEKPQNINLSTMRTLASAIDLLDLMYEKRTQTERLSKMEPNVMVVDDDDISRRAVTISLKRAQLKYVDLADPNEALQALGKSHFDLVFLDVDMPVMTGFELCAKIRTLDDYKRTPIVFITGLDDFKSRASSKLSGGNDFIAKPVVFNEVALKAWTFIMRNRLS